MGAPSRRTNSFRLLVDAHASFVGRRARNAGVPHRDVPDVVQKVFLALHEAMGRGLDSSRPLLGWLRAVTYRTARAHLRLSFNDREVLSSTGDIETADGAPTPEERMQVIDAHRITDGVLDVLPPSQRIVLAMSDIEEMPMSEIAEVLEIPIGTGYTRLRAARRSFEAEWNKRRASGHAAVLPFMLWDARDLLHAAQPTPELPPELVDEVWRRLVDAIGPSITGGAAGAAATALATKSGAALTMKQAVIGALVAALAGAGLHAALRSALDMSTEKAPAAVLITSDDKMPASSPAPTSATATASVTPAPSATSNASAVAPHVATAQDGDASERKWLESARDALEQGDLPKARKALDRIKSPRFAAERDNLRRIMLAHQDGGS